MGAGGLGSNIAMNLVRLGIKKLFILDMDVVDIHNLNRQILYSKEHIGKSKVYSAVESLQVRSCNIRRIEDMRSHIHFFPTS